MRKKERVRQSVQRSKPLISRIMIPMIILVLIQICTFVAFLSLNGGFSYIKSYSYSLLAEKTGNRKAYVENVFLQKPSLVFETADEVNSIVASVLSEAGAGTEAIRTDKELNKRILDACAQNLVTLIRRNMVNDAFIILDTGTLYDDGERRLRPGLYLRDTDVEENSLSDNKDIFMEMGSSETARSLGTTLDFEWSLYLDVTDSDSGNYDFFFEPIRTYADNVNKPLYHLGYWSSLSRISDSQQGSIKYSLPLVSEDGAVYGVIGVGILEKTIQQSIPANDFFIGSTCYVLAVDQEGSGRYLPQVYRGPSYNRLVSEDTVLSDEISAGYGLYSFASKDTPEAIGSIQRLNLYNSGSPYRIQEWALISVADKEMIMGTYYSLMHVVVLSMFLSLAVSIFAAVVTSRRISMPVARMAETLDKSRGGHDLVKFKQSGIREIDALASSIVELQADLTEYASRVSRIITMAGNTIGVFMYNCRNGSVFVGESLIKLLRFEALPDRDVTISEQEFRAQLSAVDPKNEIMSLPIFGAEEPHGQPIAVSRELQYEDADSTRWFKFILTRDTANVMGLVQDITNTVEEKKEIARVKDDEYTDRLLEANAALRAAYAAAKKADSAKTDFLSRMSHDIRTPMNAVVGMTAIARMHLDDREKLEECFNKITVSSNYLLALINEVLDMSKIESGKLVLSQEEINLPELIDSLTEILKPSVKEKGHTYTVHIEHLEHENIIGDSLRIRQVFMNILSNAIKYTPEGGRIDFIVAEKPTGKDRVGCYEFVFRDNGKGMQPDFLEKIFMPFEREEDVRVSKTQGTGLGMAISYNIVKLMNGDIHVESEIGKGTTFTVTLYLPRSEEETVSSEGGGSRQSGPEGDSLTRPAWKADFSGRRVLLAEDNELNLEIAVEIFGMAKLEVETAENGQEAVDKFVSSEPGYFDMIFMDIQMPVMNGYEAAREIRSLSRSDAKEIPIIAMTANAFAEDVRAALDSGMNEHISKPLNIGALFAVTGKWLGRERAAEEAGAAPVSMET